MSVGWGGGGGVCGGGLCAEKPLNPCQRAALLGFWGFPKYFIIHIGVQSGVWVFLPASS